MYCGCSILGYHFKKGFGFAEDGRTVNLLLTIKSLYVLNGFAAVLLYLPQIYNACKDRKHALSLSLITFGGWSIGSSISSLYAWLYVKDAIFTAISLGNMAGAGAIFVIAAYSRLNAGSDSSLADRAAACVNPLATGNESDGAAGLAQQRP